MHRFFEYTLFFLVVLLLQVFVFDNLSLSVYVAPMAYLAFMALLPLNTPHGLLVVIGFAAGVLLDFFTGTGGLHTIAATFTGFVRPGIVNLALGKDFWRDAGGVLSRRELMSGKWFRYSALLSVLHCFVYFMFEALSWQYFGHTLLKIALSSLSTVAIVWFAAYLYSLRK